MAQFQCPKCGKILERGIPKCPECGATFNWTKDPNAPKAPTAHQRPQYPPPSQQPQQQYQQPQQQYQQPQQQSQQMQQQYQQPQQPVQPQKKKVKWWMIAIAVVLILLLCRACFGGDSSSNNSSNGITSSNSNSVQQAANNEVQDKGVLGDYEVEITSAKVTKDYEGKSAVVIEYQFTNNSEEAANFMTALHSKVFQDGIELETAIIGNDDVYDSSAAMKDIKTGKTLTVYSAYVLNDETTPIEVEVSELISFSDKKVVKTFNLSE